MQAQDVVTIVAAVLVPVVTAAVGSLAILFQDWRLRRSRAGRRKLDLHLVGSLWDARVGSALLVGLSRRREPMTLAWV